MRIFLLVFHLLLTLVMIGVILIQRGEDASSGSGGGLPGARSGRNALTRTTAILASIFFANCIFMAILVQKESKIGLTENAEKKDAALDKSGQAKALDRTSAAAAEGKGAEDKGSVKGQSLPKSSAGLAAEMPKQGTASSVKTEAASKKMKTDLSKSSPIPAAKKKKKGAVSKKSA